MFKFLRSGGNASLKLTFLSGLLFWGNADCTHVSAASKFREYSIVLRVSGTRNAETQFDEFTFCNLHVFATSTFGGLFTGFLKFGKLH